MGMVVLKFHFTYLLPILVLAAVVYEFYTLGFTLEASVNKLLIGMVYGFLLYVGAYIIKIIGITVLSRLRPSESSYLEI